MSNIDKHLNNPLYKDARHDWEKAQYDQIVKGSQKYPEPFNPASWTDKELYNHFVMENVDQMHYARGLYERIKSLREENEKLQQRLSLYEGIAKLYDSICKEYHEVIEKLTNKKDTD